MIKVNIAELIKDTNLGNPLEDIDKYSENLNMYYGKYYQAIPELICIFKIRSIE